MSLFTAKVDYALRALLDLSEQPEGRSAQSREIATRQAIPEAYLNQLLVVLRRSGIVRSIRGASGGYTLGRPPRAITVGDVVRSFQGEECLSDSDAGGADGGSAWVVRELRNRLEISVRELLDGTTLADLVDEQRRMDESHGIMLGI